MKKGGLFIVFEGGEGSGKSTQAKMLYDWLVNQGYSALLTKEPGGDDGICKEIRGILLNPKHKGEMSFRAELLLFEADRAQHTERVMKPALEEGKIVISDRYEAGTFAYQCVARGICELEDFQRINNFATGGLKPDYTFWIDLAPEIGLARNAANQKRDRFEMEDIEFHRKVREGFRVYFEKFVSLSQWQKLDGELSPEKLYEQILTILKRLI